jgi:hypothetical protein
MYKYLLNSAAKTNVTICLNWFRSEAPPKCS